AIQKTAEPILKSLIVQRNFLKLTAAIMGAGRVQLILQEPGPFDYLFRSAVGMELQPVGGAVVTEGLVGKGLAAGEQLRPVRQGKAVIVPLIDLEGIGDESLARGGRSNRVVADLGVALRMLAHLGAERGRKQLRAQADAEEWFFGAQPALDGPHLVG